MLIANRYHYMQVPDRGQCVVCRVWTHTAETHAEIWLCQGTCTELYRLAQQAAERQNTPLAS